MGVVGTAVARGEPIRVPDITKFAGHIACDPTTKSEIVVPIEKMENVSHGAPGCNRLTPTRPR